MPCMSRACSAGCDDCRLQSAVSTQLRRSWTFVLNVSASEAKLLKTDEMESLSKGTEVARQVCSETLDEYSVHQESPVLHAPG